jgi:hypothetical protein
MTVMQSFELVLFMALLLMASMYALAASGHFPREHRSKVFTSALGSTILFGTIALSLICVFVGIFFVQARVPWYAAIIGGGTMVLIAPLLLQMFSDRFVDGRISLLAFSGAAGCLACAMALLQ